MKLHIVEQRNYWFLFSGVMILGSFLALGLFGLKLGIDFTGGSLIEVQAQSELNAEEIRSELTTAGHTISVQVTDKNTILIRTKDLTNEQHENLLRDLSIVVGPVDELRFDSIGSVIGGELRNTALTGLVLILLLIGVYIAWAFRKISGPITSWKYGALTILTAFHDVIVPLGVFALLGHFLGWEIDITFVAAILTILGYSINDTVVVFDRVRENLMKKIGNSFEETVELSIEQTFARSLSTSLTTLLALFAIFIFGGDTTKPFALALIIGIAVGAYSSIFMASPALVQWELRSKKK
ncbi:TPA: protein translocase subunit SecF [Candidatus Uhrbacteria bacterium]|nr:protein translocase subunit SecF [Candidatus Uhrbacteria bacterium]